MTDRKKALQGLECCSMNGKGCRQCPYNKDCDEMPDFGNAHLCSDALELLKNEPLPVLNVGKFRIYYGDCPHCGERITKKKTRYCPYCGKAVKWDE